MIEVEFLRDEIPREGRVRLNRKYFLYVSFNFWTNNREAIQRGQQIIHGGKIIHEFASNIRFIRSTVAVAVNSKYQARLNRLMKLGDKYDDAQRAIDSAMTDRTAAKQELKQEKIYNAMYDIFDELPAREQAVIRKSLSML